MGHIPALASSVMPAAAEFDVAAEGISADSIGGSPSSPDSRLRHPNTLRLVCHLAAELPLALLSIRSMTTGWRPTSDDAVVAWRAWDVMSTHPTLLGAPTHATELGHQGFAPGPALSWLLAVPVHIDPLQGTLWGSTLVALAAVALAIEAGWAAGGRWGAIGAAATALTVGTTETAILMNLPWTPWQGALWMIAALACAWATSTGRWRWWPACVATGSIAAQAHIVFALTAVAVCLVSPLLGRVSVSRRNPIRPSAARGCMIPPPTAHRPPPTAHRPPPTGQPGRCWWECWWASSSGFPRPSTNCQATRGTSQFCGIHRRLREGESVTPMPSKVWAPRPGRRSRGPTGSRLADSTPS